MDVQCLNSLHFPSYGYFYNQIALPRETTAYFVFTSREASVMGWEDYVLIPLAVSLREL